MTPEEPRGATGPVTRVRGYDDLHPVGRGGHAIVYRARQVAFDRIVALKVVSQVDVDGQAQRRFERECKAAGALSWHPHIVAVYDAGMTEAGQSYLAMEYFEAGSFADRVEREGPLPVAAAVTLGVEIAGALEAAHRAGTLHRDVKPENTLIGRYGESRLADFGIAALQKDPATLTSAGLVTATVAHAAPELFAGGRATVASDVYSLGSTLFTLLAGKPAFVEPTDEMLAAAILRVTTGPVPDLRPYGVPEGLAGVIEQAMAKDPASRPGSAAEFGRALQQLQRDAGGPVTDMRLGDTPAVAGPGQQALDGFDEDASDTITVAGVPPRARAATPPPAPPPVPPEPSPPPPAPPATPLAPPPAAPAGRRSPGVVVAVVAAAALGLGAVLFLGGGDGDEAATPTSGRPTASTATTEPAPTDETTAPTPARDPEFLDVVAVSASSTADPGFEASGAIVTYEASNTRDGLADTAWRAPGDGVGVTLVLQLPGPAEITEISLIPGYAKVDTSDGTNRFFQNRRIVRARYVFDSGATVSASFADEPALQSSPVGRIASSSVTIEILDTTDDPERDFTAISEIEVYGVPQ